MHTVASPLRCSVLLFGVVVWFGVVVCSVFGVVVWFSRAIPGGTRKARDVGKHNWDAEAISRFPSVSNIQVAVAKAMKVLAKIALEHEGKDNISPDSRGAATTALIGCIFLNSFAGRSKEWAQMKEAHFWHQLSRQDLGEVFYLEATEHNTVRTYGSLAKHVPDGNVAAIKVPSLCSRCVPSFSVVLVCCCPCVLFLGGASAQAYLGLPNPHGCELLLKPAFGSTQKVAVSHYLDRFVQAYLPKDCSPTRSVECLVFFFPSPPNSFKRGVFEERVAPTVNLARKWFHTAMASKTRAEASMKAVFERLDAHSAAVQDKVYVLKTKAEDALLSKAIIEVMFHPHGPVPWPASAGDLEAPEFQRLTVGLPVLEDAKDCLVRRVCVSSSSRAGVAFCFFL